MAGKQESIFDEKYDFQEFRRQVRLNYASDVKIPSFFPEEIRNLVKEMIGAKAEIIDRERLRKLEDEYFENLEREIEEPQDPEEKKMFDEFSMSFKESTRKAIQRAKPERLALISLCTEETIMQPLWREIFQQPKDTWWILPWALYNTFDDWENREHNSRGKQKKIAKAIIKKIQDIDYLLNQDSRVSRIVNNTFWLNIQKSLMGVSGMWAKNRSLKPHHARKKHLID